MMQSIIKENGVAEKISSLNDLGIEELTKQTDDPKALAVMMFRLLQEKQKTNELLQNINEKYDRIMFALKTGETPNTPNNTQEAEKSLYEVLPEQDQLILKAVEERGGCSAKDIKVMLNYRGLNAACQRLNKLYKEGYLKKIQSGRKVLYLAKS